MAGHDLALLCEDRNPENQQIPQAREEWGGNTLTGSTAPPIKTNSLVRISTISRTCEKTVSAGAPAPAHLPAP